MTNLRYNEKTGEFEAIENTSIQKIASSPITDASYFYLEGYPRPFQYSQLKRMNIPSNIRIRRMLEYTWHSLDYFGLTGLLDRNKRKVVANIAQVESIFMSQIVDSSYYYIEGNSIPYRGNQIKQMRLAKGVKIRKMLTNKWSVVI